MSKLEKTSIYDLYQAQTPALRLVTNAITAKVLIENLLNGKDFNAVRKAAKAAPKSKPEIILENTIGRLNLYKTSKKKAARKEVVRNLLTDFKEQISLYRHEPTKAEALLIECLLKTAELYIDEAEK